MPLGLQRVRCEWIVGRNLKIRMGNTVTARNSVPIPARGKCSRAPACHSFNTSIKTGATQQHSPRAIVVKLHFDVAIGHGMHFPDLKIKMKGRPWATLPVTRSPQT
jgi:hypothetical protein